VIDIGHNAANCMQSVIEIHMTLGARDTYPSWRT
jgi:hypothetical protein